MVCPSCNTVIEGQFELPGLLRLAPDDLRFVEDFVRASGSLKHMAAAEQQSYPTIRNRLDRIIEQLTQRDQETETKKHNILDAIAKGKLSVKEAVKRLKELGDEQR